MSDPEPTPRPDPRASIDVLLIDDDETVHFLVARRARRTGVTLAYCGDGASARTFLEEHDVALLLLDQRLPDASGDALLRELVDAGLLDGTAVSICTSAMPPSEVCERIAELGATLRMKSDILGRDALVSLLADARAPSEA